MNKISHNSSIKPYLKIFSLITIFILFLMLQLSEELGNLRLPFNGQLGTLTYWNCILIGFISIFYIFKIKKFYIWDLITGIILGCICFFRPNFINPILLSITIFSYYSAAYIFRNYGKQNYFLADFKNILNSVKTGILISIIPTITNIVEFKFINNLSVDFNLIRFPFAMFAALQPGIAEEVIFRFFLLAFVLNAFKGKLPKTNFIEFLIYFLMIVPHCLLHYQMNEFIQNPIPAILNLIYMCVFYGIPAVWLMKNKNLYAAISFHWFIDFIRFWLIGA
ncbi:MAG: CPBP family intramembrane metalloprotease [Oscillospiraceae bacterium]|jgi:hypothetical protein|nr:CPBP family intramembrane metalloprotease [Oscillospiraceae bacterium]